MNSFLESSSRINADIKTANAYIDAYKKYAFNRTSAVLSSEDELDINKKIASISSIFSKLSNKIKNEIRKNQNETAELIKNGERKGYIDMRELHTFRQGRDLADVVRQFHEAEAEYCEQEKDKLKEMYRVANPDAKESDLEIISNADMGDSLLASAFALGSHSAKNVLDEARARRDIIEIISTRIDELSRLIEDMADLVNRDGHVIDEICINMSSTVNNTTKANKQLTSALESTIRWNWWKRLLYLVAVVVIIGIVFKIFKLENLFKSKTHN